MFKEATERVRSIPYVQILDEVLDEQRYFILDLIRFSQLIDGKGGDGDLNEYAWYRNGSQLSKEWIDYKHKIGLFIGDGDPKYDLLGDTGELYNSLIVQIKKDYLDIEFQDSKLPLVEAATSMILNNSNVLTLNPENLQILIDRIEPLIQNKINDHLGI